MNWIKIPEESSADDVAELAKCRRRFVALCVALCSLTLLLQSFLCHKLNNTMVITTCGSCNTLVSIDEGLKERINGEVRSACCEEHVFQRSELLVPEDLYKDDDYWCMAAQEEQNIYLPSNKNDAVDICLKSNAQIMETADTLLANPPKFFSSQSPERILYVAQGEIAHAVPSQCDVLVSDKATTCHILAVRSTSPGGCAPPLASLTHVDGTQYETCIRDMIAEHKLHHATSIVCGYCEEKKDDYFGVIEMDVHLMGGFEDENGASRATSNFLIHLLARIASEERTLLRMTLQTCAITSMNDNGYSCPIGRGMGINLHTGECFLATVDSSAAGPLQDVRSVRLWMSPKKLSVIHTPRSDNFVISPFYFAPFPEVDSLLQLNDDMLLNCTSTSPDVEESDFCDNVRTSLEFLKNYESHDIFPSNQPILLRRDDSNSWKRCT